MNISFSKPLSENLQQPGLKNQPALNSHLTSADLQGEMRVQATVNRVERSCFVAMFGLCHLESA